MEGDIPLAIMAIVARVLNLIVIHSIRYEQQSYSSAQQLRYLLLNVHPNLILGAQFFGVSERFKIDEGSAYTY
jgi:hypothetical protein